MLPVFGNNKDIKGIVIEDEEYKISQYADDTSIISDGSPESMDGILRELDFFANISGLKINFSKTNMIWIGSKKFSKEIFHHSRWKLNWSNTNFEMLGIKFSVNLREMIDINYDNKLLNIKKIIDQWKGRKLTPLGRLSIIKSLLIPKLNHLILTLPNPGEEYLKKIEFEFYKFLWGSNVHKIKKNTIVQDYRFGGLKMTDYNECIVALKSSWIRRMIHANNKWVRLLESILEIKISELLSKGSNFLLNTSQRIDNMLLLKIVYYL